MFRHTIFTHWYREEGTMINVTKRDRQIAFPAVVSILMLLFCACVPQGQMPTSGGWSGDSAYPVIEKFEAYPPKVTEGGTSTLHWRTRNAISVTISGIGEVPTSGSREVTIGKEGTYVLTAAGRDGRTVSHEKNIGMYTIAGNIPKPPIIEKFEAHPPGAMAGDTITLRWRTRNALSAAISGIGNVPLNGERAVAPGITYVLTVTGYGGQRITAERGTTVYQPQVIGENPDPPLQLKDDKPAIIPGEIVRPNRPIRVIPIRALPAPMLQSPPSGKRFSHYPRRTTLSWSAVQGAAAYTVEIDCYGCCRANRWCTDIGRTHKMVKSIRSTTYTFNFVGAQPGRWRVWAVDQNGNPGGKSAWWTFSYTR